MIRKSILIIMQLPFIIVVLLSCSTRNSEIEKTRNEAINKIDVIYANAKYHQSGIQDVKRLIKKSEHNIDLIVNIAEYISIVPYETETLTRIAVIASNADKECAELMDVVELPIILTGRSEEVVRAAELCVQIKDEAERIKFKEEIQRLRSYAKYSTVDEAFKV